MSRWRTIGLVLAALGVAALVPLVVSLGELGRGSPTTGAARAAADRAQAAEGTAARMGAEGVLDIPVRFAVRNVNRSPAPCATPEADYEVSGHLTAPAAVLDTPNPDVTLYLHDLATSEWYWRLDVPGYHHAEEMARRGHASVTIDRLGYGATGDLNGYYLCVGAQADVANQIVAALRTGGYTTDGLAAAPAFGEVFLAGHGAGAQIAQLAATFGDVDGLVVMGWADMGRTDRFMTSFFGNLSTCMQQVGPDQQPATDGGYAYFDVGVARFRETNFADTDPAVLAAALPRQDRHPCKELTSQLEAISTDLRILPTITVPVLGVYGADDRLFQDGAGQLALFHSSPDTELITVPQGGHYVGLGQNARLVHDGLAAWLDRH